MAIHPRGWPGGACLRCLGLLRLRITPMELLQIGSEVDVRLPPDLGGTTARHKILGLRAKGGQGYVYTLRGTEGRPWVLKVPSPQGLVSNEIERQILLQLPPHRNIVRLAGTAHIQGVECPLFHWAHENPYLRLNDPALEGATKPFRGIAPRTALPATTAIEMIHEVLLALEHLHKLGFVHGDVKSANVLTTVDSERFRLGNHDYFNAIQQRAFRTTLVDFGSTRSTAFLESMDQRDEALAPSEFTPLYAPPEVFKGVGTSKGGPAVDAYQVGLMLYQWISGYPPYDHVLPNLVREGLTNELVDVKRAEKEGKVRPYDALKLKTARQHDVVFAEAFAAQRLRDRFFEDVLALIDFCTAPDPAARPTIGTLRAEVQRLFELEPPKGQAEGLTLVAAWNPRWHLTRENRLAAVARVADPQPAVRGDAPRKSASSERNPLPATAAAARGSRPAAPPPNAGETLAVAEAPQETRPGAPAPAAPAPASTPPPPPAAEQKPRGPRVALVDDDKVALAILARSLRRRGFLVRTFQDPESALHSISHDQPDAAIVDMHMPGMTGLELVKELSRRLGGRPFPLMVLTSVEDETALKEAYRAGVSDYLIKPVTEAELAVKLTNAIDQHAQKTPDAVPRELAGFELLEEVRRGEGAVVYRAADMWGRYPDVMKGIKVLRPELAGDLEPTLKLAREIEVLAHCNHPGVARLHISGQWGRLLFYVTDEVPPQSLGEWLREKERLDAAGTARLLRDLASGLEHLHQQGWILGDLTPEGVGRTTQGNLLLMELGCARRVGGVSRGDLPRPPTSRYLAPEWFLDPPQPEPRSDLFALGVIALEAFTGRPAPRQRRGGAVDLRAASEEMPPELGPLVASLLAQDPGRRPADAGAILARLARVG